MEEREKSVFSLPAVKFAPFFAAGMLLAYFCGSISAWLIPLAGVGFAIAFAKKRAFSACFAGILAGLLPKTIRAKLTVEENPVLSAIRAKLTVSEIPVLNAIRVHKNKWK